MMKSSSFAEQFNTAQLQNNNDNAEYLTYSEDVHSMYYCCCKYRRYILVLFLFFGLCLSGTLTFDISVAIEPMSCEFKWSNKVQGIIFASCFGGYLFGNIPGAWCASRYGGKLIFGFGLLLSSSVTILLPFFVSLSFSRDTSLSCKCDYSIASDWCFNNGHYTKHCNNMQSDICNKAPYDTITTAWIILCVLRFFIGFGVGMMYPSIFSLIGNWTPKNERSKMLAITFSGILFGNVAGFSLSSLILATNNEIIEGWYNIFYLWGLLGLIFSALFFLFTSNSPINDYYITQKELLYLQHELPHLMEQQEGSTAAPSAPPDSYSQPSAFDDFQHIINIHGDSVHTSTSSSSNGGGSGRRGGSLIKVTEVKIPWKEILTNKIVICLYVTHFAYSWMSYTVYTELPSYLNKQLNYDMSSSGILIIIPSIGSLFVSIITAIFIDKLIEYKIFSTTFCRKIAQNLGMVIPAILLICCGYLTDKTSAFILLSISTAMMGACTSGVAANLVDISPTFCNVIFGVSNSMAQIPGIAAPIINGLILEKNPDLDEWRLVLCISSAISLVAAIYYSIMSKSEYIPRLNAQK